MGSSDWLVDVEWSYDSAAEGYSAFVADGLDPHPDARGALAWFVEALRGIEGSVLDAGCGPGHVAAHLSAEGLEVVGIDLSSRMIEVARREHPGLRFELASMTELPFPDSSFAGVLSFWSVVHTPDDAMPAVITELTRVLRPDGALLVGFHEGDGHRRKTEGYGGHAMDVEVYRRPVARMTSWLEDAGLVVELEALTGAPGTPRGAVVLARRPA